MLKGKITVDSNISGSLSNKKKLLDHEALYNRNAQNAHPIEAITGLLTVLEDLKRTSETLAANFYRHENSINNAVVNETKRAKKAEASLESHMNQLSDEISSISDIIENEQTDFSTELNIEKIERNKADERLNKQLSSLDKKLENLIDTNNNHIKKSEKDIEDINLTLLNNEETFAQHLNDFDTHVSRLNELILSFNRHLDSFESHLRDEAETENNINEAIQELETRLSREFSDRLTNEKNQLTADLNDLETLVVSKIDTQKTLFDSELNKTKNDILNYTNSQTELIKDELEVIDQKYINELSLLNEKIVTEADSLKASIRSLEEDLNTLDDDNQAEHRLLSDRIDATNILLNDFAETLREQAEQISFRIEEVQNNLSNTDNALQVFKDNSEIALNRIVEGYKEADKNTLLEAQDYARNLVTPIDTRINQLESWKSNITNVMDFVGITTTDITKEDNKKNSTIKINDYYYTAIKGDVVLYNDKEYVWTGGEEESLGWEEFGIGSANEAAIAALQTTVGSRSDLEGSSGIFKEIDNLRASLEGQLAEEITQIDQDIESINENLSNLNTNITTRWIKPESLIFSSKEAISNYLDTQRDQVYPGQLFTIDTAGVLESYILDTSGNLQIFSSGGGDTSTSGSPKWKTMKGSE